MSEAADPMGPRPPRERWDQQLPVPPAALWPTLWQVWLKMFLMTPPNAKTTTTIRAAMPAMSRPYSTVDVPRQNRRAVPLGDALGAGEGGRVRRGWGAWPP